jgi:hypothetical protein
VGAVRLAIDGDGAGAARRHISAAKEHEAAGTDAARDGDMGSAETHFSAADLHRRAAAMHAAGTPPDDEDEDDDDDEAPNRNRRVASNEEDDECDEDDEECQYEEMTSNRSRMILNARRDDPLPVPETFPSSPGPARRRVTANLSRTASRGDTLDIPSCILSNYAGSREAFRAVVNAQGGFRNEGDQRGPGGQPKLHSWDGGIFGSVEQGGVRLGATAGDPSFGDRIQPRNLSPEELLDEIMRHDEVTAENRRRQGLPDGDIEVDDVLDSGPGAIGQILGEHRTIRKTNQG